VDDLNEDNALDEDDVLVPQPPRLQLSFENVSAVGMYLLDAGDQMFLYLARGLHQFVLERVFGVTT